MSAGTDIVAVPSQPVSIPGKEMGSPEIASREKMHTKNYGTLGKEIKISPKSMVRVNNPGAYMEFFVPTIEVLISIGKDETARLIMPESAWEALKNGSDVSILTLKEFKEKFL